jgi:signal transduction histidine kinase
VSRRVTWTSWPSREALAREGATRYRRLRAWAGRVFVTGLLLWRGVSEHPVLTWRTLFDVVAVTGCVLGVWVFFRLTLARRLWASLLVLLAAAGLAVAARAVGFDVLAVVVWCGVVVVALRRLPWAAAAPVAAGALAGYAVTADDSWPTTAATAAGLLLLGHALRLDAEARGNALRLQLRERAALEAQAESAALTERARIAREMHDLLAHSLSAQLVHLEAARLLIERDAERERILERVVAARAMAREGLAETRQALSALRGETAPVEEYLRDLAALTEATAVEVGGERRVLSAEAAQTVRRVAQEALTNVRRHAPGARVRLRLAYEDAHVALEVRDFGAVRDPGRDGGGPVPAGSGYGLLGMRERAELLGGTLEAGPDEEGFVVRLRVPA